MRPFPYQKCWGLKVKLTKHHEVNDCDQLTKSCHLTLFCVLIKVSSIYVNESLGHNLMSTQKEINAFFLKYHNKICGKKLMELEFFSLRIWFSRSINLLSPNIVFHGFLGLNLSNLKCSHLGYFDYITYQYFIPQCRACNWLINNSYFYSYFIFSLNSFFGFYSFSYPHSCDKSHCLLIQTFTGKVCVFCDRITDKILVSFLSENSIKYSF